MRRGGAHLPPEARPLEVPEGGRRAEASALALLRGSRSASAERHKPRLVAAPTLEACEAMAKQAARQIPFQLLPHGPYTRPGATRSRAPRPPPRHTACRGSPAPHGRGCWTPVFDARRPERARRPLRKPEAHASSLQSRGLALAAPCPGRLLVCPGHLAIRRGALTSPRRPPLRSFVAGGPRYVTEPR